MEFTSITTHVNLPESLEVEGQLCRSVKVETEWDGNISIIKVFPIFEIFEEEFFPSLVFDIEQPYWPSVSRAFTEHIYVVNGIKNKHIDLSKYELTEIFLLYPYYNQSA